MLGTQLIVFVDKIFESTYGDGGTIGFFGLIFFVKLTVTIDLTSLLWNYAWNGSSGKIVFFRIFT